MRVGIFARTFRAPSLVNLLQIIAQHDIQAVHFNLSCVGLESLPETLSRQDCIEIQKTFTRYDLNMCGISGTYNAIHPNKSLRAEQTRRACLLIERCHLLGTNLVTLCTGTRNPTNMWADHPGNQDLSAWNDLCNTLNQLVPVAEQHNAILGIEPEPSNVINSALKARRLLDQFKSKSLKIVLDLANLVGAAQINRLRFIFDEAIELLGPDIVVAHAKEIPRGAGLSTSVGEGLIDWDYYVHKLHAIGYDQALVMHNLTEAEVPASFAFLNRLVKCPR